MTLVELLVVIAVIAVIAGIMYRSLYQARERAHLATCISNLRQLVQAVHMYEQDWGTVPIEYRMKTSEGIYGFVQQILFPNYVKDKSLFICPADPYQGTRPFIVFWKGEKWPILYPYFINFVTVKEYGRGNPRLKPRSGLFICGFHKKEFQIDVIARYDGSIELAPRGRYKIIRPEFEGGIGSEDFEDPELLP